MRTQLIKKIFDRHPDTTGIKIHQRTKCPMCGRTFNYIVEDNVVSGLCVRGDCMALESEPMPTGAQSLKMIKESLA